MDLGAWLLGLGHFPRLFQIPPVSDGIFRHPHRVTYAECTLGNHIYYARYFDLLEEARGEFFRHLGQTFLELQSAGVIFPVLEARANYRGAARYDDALVIELWVMTAERVRLDFGYRIAGPDGRTLVEAVTRHVCTSLEDRPQRLPAGLRERLIPYLRNASGTGNSSCDEVAAP